MAGPTDAPALDDVKDRLRAEVTARADVLLDASHRIWEQPELNFEEHHAHDLLAGILEAEGLEVERRRYGVDTAFAARAGRTARRSPCCASTTRCPRSATPAATTSSPRPGLGAGLAAAAVARGGRGPGA